MNQENNVTKLLAKKLWNQKFYYDQARVAIKKAIEDKDPFLLKLKNYTHQAKNILDCGCGCASILETLWQKDKNLYGIDLSPFAIQMAKKRLLNKKKIKLSVMTIEKLKFESGAFDLVYAITVLEHLANPEKAIKEMIRVTKNGGYLILSSPNFGSPFYPPFNQSLKSFSFLFRMSKILLKSHFYLLIKPKGLSWTHVYPRFLKEKKYQSDWDTVVEPNLQTLLIFLKNYRLTPREVYSSLQAASDKIPMETDKSLFKNIFRTFLRWLHFIIEKIGVPPYCYYGPNFFVVAKK